MYYSKFTRFTVLCSLYESLTVHYKIHDKNLLLNSSSVYSEVNGPERSWASFTVCRCAIAFNGRSSDGSERRWASFFVYRCAIAFNGQSSDGSERRWASFSMCLYQCAIWLVSMLASMLVSILRLLDSVPLSCTFLRVSMCVVASAL